MAHLTIASCVRSIPFVLFSCACASTPRVEEPKSGKEALEVTERLPPLEGSTGPQKPRSFQRRVGDVWVHRFSGAYRNEALVLREEVLAKKGNLFVVDYLLSDGKGDVHLRVELTERTERVVSVSRIEDGKAVAATIADYEAMIEKTVFVPEKNDGKVAEKTQTCLVGSDELRCDIAQYRVVVDDRSATLEVARNEDLKRDLSGEVTAVDGTILYSAELLEMRRGKEAPAGSGEGVASWDPFLD